MIRLHDANTRWWGSPVGIIDDSAFFTLPPSEQRKALEAYDWVEFRSNFTEAPHPALLAEAGFLQVDTQVRFRIDLKRCIDEISGEHHVAFADQPAFRFHGEGLAALRHERFQYVAGCTPQRLQQRYVNWAEQLIETYTETCLVVISGEEIQGWFLARPAGGELELTLAAAHRHARCSGFVLYRAGLAAYAARGYRIGFASFSIGNTAVHNIYAKLGARFTAPVGVWFWDSPQRTKRDEQ